MCLLAVDFLISLNIQSHRLCDTVSEPSLDQSFPISLAHGYHDERHGDDGPR